MDQRGLVERAAQGDHDAFAALAGAAVARLDAAARLILRDPELARDAVQETLVRAWRDLPRLRDPDRFDAWLHRIVTNASLGVWRRRRRRPIEVELLNTDAAVLEDVWVCRWRLTPAAWSHPRLGRVNEARWAGR